MRRKWTKRVVGYGLLVTGWVGFGHLVPHDFISWKFVGMTAVALCFAIGSSVLDFAKYGLWPTEAEDIVRDRLAQRAR